MKKYGFGRYTPVALFKVPWVLRLQGKLDLAIKGFNNILTFYKSSNYKKLKEEFSVSNSFVPAAYYWMAQTLLAQKNQDEATRQRHLLIELHPFNFYSLISRIELGIDIKSLYEEKEMKVIKLRKEGLGDLQKKRLVRAEQLISVGLMEYGIRELSFLEEESMEDLDFIQYLAKLNYLAGEFHKSIRLSWKIVSGDKLNNLGKSLRDLLYPRAFLDEVKSEVKGSLPDPFFILALIRQESGFDPKIKSSANAVGLMQLLPSTARQVALTRGEEVPDEEKLKNPRVNIALGINYLKDLLRKFESNSVYALASYNAGPQKVRNWLTLRPRLSIMEFIESIPYNETRGYVKKVLRNYYIYSAFYANRSFQIDGLFQISSGN